jgi:IS5 family transposase
VIETRRAQRSFGDGLIAAEVADLHEAWMRQADRALDDPQIVAVVHEALAQQHPQEPLAWPAWRPSRGRAASAGAQAREARANLVYRDFTRVGGAKTPDAKTMGRWGVALGPAVIEQVHERIVQIAHENGVTPGRRLSIDTTVVETNIHYPTESSLLGDGVRMLTRTMKKIAGIAETAGAKLRDRTRSVRHHLLTSPAARSKSQPNQEKLTEIYASCSPPRGAWSAKPNASRARSPAA